MVQTGTALHIIHCDMDAFFASVEQRDQAHLRGKPVIVGGKPQSRGVVSTCSYEARAFGVRSAMPLAQAYRLCPQGIFLPVRMHRYQEVSSQIMALFRQFTPAIEVLSIDEAFLDVQGSEQLFGDAAAIAAEIKKRILAEIGLIVSVGISYNKFLAKLGSDLGKPDGFTVIPEEDATRILAPLPVQRLWGVGPKTGNQLRKLGYQTIGDIQNIPLTTIERQLGNAGRQLWMLAHGCDDRPIETERQRQSIGRETTFPEDILDRSILEQVLYQFADELAFLLRRAGQKASTVTVKLRYSDFRTITRSQSIEPTDFNHVIIDTALHLLEQCKTGKTRLIGLSLSNFAEESMVQGNLFAPDNHQKDEKLYELMDSMRERFGEHSLVRARNLPPPGTDER